MLTVLSAQAMHCDKFLASPRCRLLLPLSASSVSSQRLLKKESLVVVLEAKGGKKGERKEYLSCLAQLPAADGVTYLPTY